VGVLLIGFAVMDGFDLGTAALLPFVGRTDNERRVVINTVGPVWEGNQVWFILGGGAIFAAWPALYAASFSGLYLAMFLVLVTLILRPAGFKFRSKVENSTWRSFWDWALFAGGLVPSLIFGVAFGNLFQGIAFYFDEDLRFHSHVTLLSLLNPFALLVGLVSLSMIVLHGATWLNLKTEGAVQARARKVIPWAAFVYSLLFVAAGLWLSHIDGYHVAKDTMHDGPSNPTLKTVSIVAGGWIKNSTLPAVAMALAGAIAATLLRKQPLLALLCSALVPFGTITTAGLALFPFLLPSSSHPNMSLTVWDASSSKLTLEIILGVVVLILPFVIAYTGFAYRVLRGPVREQDLSGHSY
jgi:cytochrome d ubiquinol oxidase subunit II